MSKQTPKRYDVLQLKDLTVGDRFFFQHALKKAYQVIAIDNGIAIYAPNEFSKRIRASKKTMDNEVVYLRTVKPKLS